MDFTPLVSVFMPVYNGATYLEEAMWSILNQDFTDFEFLIINDGSTDASEEIIRSFNDPRINLVNNERNLGLIATLNKGLQIVKGKYIVRMDADDISLQQRIGKQVAFLENNPETGILGSWFEDFGEGIPKQIVRYSSDDTYIRIRHLYQTHIAHPTAVLRTSVIREHALQFDPEFVHGEDYEFWVRMSQYCNMSNFPEVLVRKRDHPKNISNQYSQTMHQTCAKVKLSQFSRMGLKLNAEDMNLYTRFADPEWGFSLVEMKKLSALLNTITHANDKTAVIPAQAYRKYLAETWFHLCYQNKQIRKDALTLVNQMVFRDSYKPGAIHTLKIYFRTFLPVFG